MAKSKSSEQLAHEYLDILKKSDPRFIKEQNPAPNENNPPQRKNLAFQNKPKYHQSDDDRRAFAKIKTAIDHYLKGDPKLANNPGFLFSHLNGIDFKMPVEVVSLVEGTEINQMQAPGKGVGATRQGEYYAPMKVDVQSDADLRGIADSSLIQEHANTH